jgi:hypothetical protein
VSVFGSIITGTQLEDAAEATIKLWVADYVAELERITGRDVGSIALPRSYGRVNHFDKKPEEQTPAVILISPGLTDPPERDGDGTWSAWFGLSIGVVVSAADRASTNELAKIYAAAVRTLILQHPSLGGFASNVRYLDEGTGEVDARYLEIGAVGQVDFAFFVEGIADDSQGPAQPSAPPDYDQPDLPVIQRVEIDTTARSLS